MTSFMRNKPLYFNKILRDYYSKTINESIEKIIENYNLERKNIQFKNLIDNDNDTPKNPKLDFYSLLIFLSISSISFYFYKRLN